MLNGITELLNEVIADPESIQIPKSDHEESQEIKRLNAEISKALNTVSFDKEAIKQKNVHLRERKIHEPWNGRNHGSKPKRYIQDCAAADSL